MGKNNAVQLSSDVLDILTAGGDLPQKDVKPLEDDFVDEELLREIGHLVATGATVNKVAKALDAPPERISATLRRERRRIALILFTGVAKNLSVFTARYYGILDKVVTEMERRASDKEWLESVETKDLIRFAQVIAGWVQPVQKALVLEAQDDKQKLEIHAGPQQITNHSIQLLAREAHSVKEIVTTEIEARTESRRLPTQKDPRITDVESE